MNRFVLIGLAPFAFAAPVMAQPMDHASMPGMAMPAQPAKSVKKPAAPTPLASKPAAQEAPAIEPQPTAIGAEPDPASIPAMAKPGGEPAMSALEIPKSQPPPAPTDRAADRFFAPDAMAAARGQLQREHGAAPVSKVMANLAEYQARKGADGYRWEGQAWFGGDINRFVLKSEGEGTRGQGIDGAEVQALYSRAVGVYTDLQMGVRQDFKPRNRTYATVGFETLAPYWFDISGAAFLSNKGELLGRVEGTYDLRLTNRLILQPRAELNFAAQDTRETRTGSGLSNAELGLRLRYEVRREFAPYIGVSWDRRFGKTADYARALGEGVVSKSLVFGVRAFF